MRFSLIVPPWAKADIRNAVWWYNRQRSGLGKDFFAVVDKIIQGLAHTPHRHQIIQANVRRACLPRFPYCVYYFVEGQNVEILGVIHSKRDPSVWQARIRP